MLKVVNIVGTRPQIIKASALSRAIRENHRDTIDEVMVDTGQHYDRELSAMFFEELQLPKPHYNLDVGSGNHGWQTATIMIRLEEVLLKEKPDVVVVYGDTNSTLASAIAATKLHYPVVHIEAGLRSFNRSMPEEINRMVCDHVSTLLFTPTDAAYKNLIHEGLSLENKPPYTIDNPGIFQCGDIMYDNSLYFGKQTKRHSEILRRFGIENGNFILATVHRDHNTDNKERLESVFNALNKISAKEQIPIILPLHPRTLKATNRNLSQKLVVEIRNNEFLRIIPPVSYLEMIALEKHCKIIITDSGGVQKEAHFFRKPCIVLRPETEWVELVDNETALLADTDISKITEAYYHFSSQNDFSYPEFYGNGKTAEFICTEIIHAFKKGSG